VKDARLKSRNFAIVASGTKCLKLMVSKMKIKDSELLAAKTQYKGNAVYKGVVTGGTGNELVFQVLEDANLDTAKFKTFIKENAGLELKPVFQTVTALGQVDDGDEDDGGALETGQKERDYFLESMGPRVAALLDADVQLNINGFFDKRSKFSKQWTDYGKLSIRKPEDISKDEKLRKEIRGDFQELVGLPDKLIKLRNRLVSKFKSDLAEIEEFLKLGRPLLGRLSEKQQGALGAVQKLRKPGATDKWTNAENFQKADKAMETLLEALATARDEMAEEAKSKSTNIQVSFNGKELAADGDFNAKLSALTNKIKNALPQNGHGNISQALNDVILGRGKATTGHSGVLHASAGKSGAAGGCTLFFTRDGSGNVDVVGVGQHKTSTSYQIYNGLGLEGKVLEL
jgi:hypothetical protein